MVQHYCEAGTLSAAGYQAQTAQGRYGSNYDMSGISSRYDLAHVNVKVQNSTNQCT